MKSLTKEQFRQKSSIAQSIVDVTGDLQNAIDQYNLQMSTSFVPIEELQGRYNELVAEARGFIETIHDQQEAYMEERSDPWRNGDPGEVYRDWAGEWTIDLEEIEIYAPEPIEELVADAVDLFRDLPDHP